MRRLSKALSFLMALLMVLSIAVPSAYATNAGYGREGKGDVGYACGFDEHVHVDACYTLDPILSLLANHGLSDTDRIVYIVHQHTDSCYTDGTLACPYADADYLSRYPNVRIVHQHDEDCNVGCGIPTMDYEIADRYPDNNGNTDGEFSTDDGVYVNGSIGAFKDTGETMSSGSVFVYNDDMDDGRPLVLDGNGMDGWVISCGKAEHVHDERCMAGGTKPAFNVPGISSIVGKFATAPMAASTINGVTMKTYWYSGTSCTDISASAQRTNVNVNVPANNNTAVFSTSNFGKATYSGIGINAYVDLTFDSSAVNTAGSVEITIPKKCGEASLRGSSYPLVRLDDTTCKTTLEALGLFTVTSSSSAIIIKNKAMSGTHVGFFLPYQVYGSYYWPKDGTFSLPISVKCNGVTENYTLTGKLTANVSTAALSVAPSGYVRENVGDLQTGGCTTEVVKFSDALYDLYGISMTDFRTLKQDNIITVATFMVQRVSSMQIKPYVTPTIGNGGRVLGVAGCYWGANFSGGSSNTKMTEENGTWVSKNTYLESANTYNNTHHVAISVLMATPKSSQSGSTVRVSCNVSVDFKCGDYVYTTRTAAVNTTVSKLTEPADTEGEFELQSIGNRDDGFCNVGYYWIRSGRDCHIGNPGRWNQGFRSTAIGSIWNPDESKFYTHTVFADTFIARTSSVYNTWTNVDTNAYYYKSIRVGVMDGQGTTNPKGHFSGYESGITAANLKNAGMDRDLRIYVATKSSPNTWSLDGTIPFENAFLSDYKSGTTAFYKDIDTFGFSYVFRANDVIRFRIDYPAAYGLSSIVVVPDLVLRGSGHGSSFLNYIWNASGNSNATGLYSNHVIGYGMSYMDSNGAQMCPSTRWIDPDKNSWVVTQYGSNEGIIGSLMSSYSRNLYSNFGYNWSNKLPFRAFGYNNTWYTGPLTEKGFTATMVSLNGSKMVTGTSVRTMKYDIAGGIKTQYPWSGAESSVPEYVDYVKGMYDSAVTSKTTLFADKAVVNVLLPKGVKAVSVSKKSSFSVNSSGSTPYLFGNGLQYVSNIRNGGGSMSLAASSKIGSDGTVLSWDAFDNYQNSGRQLVKVTMSGRMPLFGVKERCSQVYDPTYENGAYGCCFSPFTLETEADTIVLSNGTYDAYVSWQLYQGDKAISVPSSSSSMSNDNGTYCPIRNGSNNQYAMHGAFGHSESYSVGYLNSVNFTVSNAPSATRVESGCRSGNGAWTSGSTTCVIDPSTGSYQYRVKYGVIGERSKNLVLFDFLESDATKHGVLESIDLSDPIGKGLSPVVYVNNTKMDSTIAGVKGITDVVLSSQQNGWIKVANPSAYTGWHDVKAVAVSFGSYQFSGSSQSGVSGVSVVFNMNAKGGEWAYGSNTTGSTGAFRDIIGSDSRSTLTEEAKASLDVSIDNAGRKTVDGTTRTEIREEGGSYRYRLSYRAKEGTSIATDVVLYDKIENGSSSRTAGTVTGIDLSGCVGIPVEVYAVGLGQGDNIPAAVAEIPGAWKKIDPGTFTSWSSVSDLAFYFGTHEFAPSSNEVYVEILMASRLDGKNSTGAVANPNATGVTIKFSESSKCESTSWDWVEIYWQKDGKYYKSNKIGGAGKWPSVNIPSSEFWLYWRTDRSTCNYYGFDVASIEPCVDGFVTGKSVSGLPNYAIQEAVSLEELTSAFDTDHPHGNYGNNVNKLWHFNYGSSPNLLVNTMRATARSVYVESRRTMSGNSVQVDIAYEIPDAPMQTSPLPKTGGSGTEAYVVMGVVFVAAAGAMLVGRRKRK